MGIGIVSIGESIGKIKMSVEGCALNFPPHSTDGSTYESSHVNGLQSVAILGLSRVMPYVTTNNIYTVGLDPCLRSKS